MTHEPQRIQPEGRTIEIGKETIGGKSKLGKSTRRKRQSGFKSSSLQKHEQCPATWYSWIMAEYKRELKAYPDWRREARKGLDKIKAKERYAGLSPEEKRKREDDAKAKRSPKQKENRNIWFRKYTKQRMAESPSLRIMRSVRSRFKKILHGQRLGSAKDLIGCSGDELKLHLERQFKRGMSWDNYGPAWHIDHIIPCASFDQAVMAQRLACWHWTNLRPLWAKENMSKGKSITAPQMSLLMEFAA